MTSRRVGAGFYLRALLRDPVVLAAVLILVLIIGSSVFASGIAPFDPVEPMLNRRNLPPMSRTPDSAIPHIFGTDQLGRDILSRSMMAGRISLGVGFAAALLAGVVGSTLGAIAGYFGGRVRDLIMRAVDLQMGFPALFLAIFVLFVVGGGLFNVVVVLALARWPVFARVARSEVESIRQAAYLDSAKVIGCSTSRVLWRHIAPNILSPLLILGTLEIARVILAESSLSFLGLGIQPPDASWGVMIDAGRLYITQAWWLIVIPGFMIFLVALSTNLIANWARQVTDPAQRWRWLGAATARPVRGQESE